MRGAELDSAKKNIGLYGFTGCNGDQLVVIHNEDRLLEFFGAGVIKSFSLAKSDNDESELDIAFIEGSISNEEQEHHVKSIRERSKILVALGNCACTGGIQSMTLDEDWAVRFKKVYGPAKLAKRHPIPSRPVNAVVAVDFYLPGCPVDADQLFYAVGQLALGHTPSMPDYPVCGECRWRENECLLLKNIPCIGPVTAAGCGAVCPSHNLPCLGCFGPVEESNVASEYKLLQEKGFDQEMIKRRIRIHAGTGHNESMKKL
jgi:sulfhydrogenase subunit delta